MSAPQPQYAAPVYAAPAAAPATANFVSRACAAAKSYSTILLVLVVVLTLGIVAMYIYYNGYIGGYTGPAGSKPKKTPPPDDDAPVARGEAGRLADSINGY